MERIQIEPTALRQATYEDLSEVGNNSRVCDVCQKCTICGDCHDCEDCSDCSEYTSSVKMCLGSYNKLQKVGCLVFLNRKLERTELRELKDQFGVRFITRSLPMPIEKLLDDAGLKATDRHCYFIKDRSGVMAITLKVPDITMSWINEDQYRFVLDNHIRYCVLDGLGRPKDYTPNIKRVKDGFKIDMRPRIIKGVGKAEAKRQKLCRRANAILKSFKALL